MLETKVDIKSRVGQYLHFTHEETEAKEGKKDDHKMIKLDNDHPGIINKSPYLLDR